MLVPSWEHLGSKQAKALLPQTLGLLDVSHLFTATGSNFQGYPRKGYLPRELEILINKTLNQKVYSLILEHLTHLLPQYHLLQEASRRVLLLPISVVSYNNSLMPTVCPSLNVDPFFHEGVHIHVASHLDHGRKPSGAVNNISSRVLRAHQPGTVLNVSIGAFASANSLVAPVGSTLSPITTTKPQQKNNKT